MKYSQCKNGNTKGKSDLGVTSTQIGQARENVAPLFASSISIIWRKINMHFKKNTVCGYTMAQAQKIIDHAPARTLLLHPRDVDYPALLELYRQYRFKKEHPFILMAAAFALGHAIGVRDERARHHGAEVVQPEQAEIDAAKNAVEIEAIIAAMRAMAKGKPETAAETISAGKSGREPVPVDAVPA